MKRNLIISLLFLFIGAFLNDFTKFKHLVQFFNTIGILGTLIPGIGLIARNMAGIEN